MSKTRGFTLIELMTVVAILAILGTAAAPHLATFVANQRVRNASFDLVSDLLLARSEALKLQADVVVTPAQVVDGEWTGGWTITSPSGTVASRTGLQPAVRFAAVDSSGNAVASLRFGGTNGGRLASPATSVRIGVKAADVDTSRWSCVRLDATGRARGDKGGCA